MTNTTNPLDSIRAHGWNLVADHADTTITGEPIRKTIIGKIGGTETITILSDKLDGLEKAAAQLERRMARR